MDIKNGIQYVNHNLAQQRLPKAVNTNRISSQDSSKTFKNSIFPLATSFSIINEKNKHKLNAKKVQSGEKPATFLY